MDGQCKEASRWVSLLVAEVYYPNAKQQPLANIIPQSSQLKPTIYNELNSKLNGGQSLPTGTFPVSAADQNIANFDLFNSLLPASYNEYNHYDQTFARRASKHHQPTNQITNQPTNQKMQQNYPIATAASYALPQYQDFNSNNQYQELNLNGNSQYQPNLNYNQFNQLVNSAQYQQAVKQSTNQQPVTQAQAKAQFQQLIDLYQQQINRQQQQQYLQQQFAKSKPYAGTAGATSTTYGNLIPIIDNLSSASMAYPTVVSQSSGGGLSPQQQMLSSQSIQAQQSNGKLMNGADSKQNEIKPRSFDTVNSHLLESTLLKSSYINNNNNDDSMIAAASSSSNDKMSSNEANTNRQPTDANLNSSNTGEHNETNTKENGEECDGYDSNGCYVIRVYYDWFLVSGSCKCWKATKAGGFETLKKIFIGKWAVLGSATEIGSKSFMISI